ncbi:HDR055Wp [Eremothecium sinecaudum]|uniref:HDR055Wp n=1 Tax=Eremothecium sinecaudum TaxID=45286 RepID=A0A0X8HSP5_9SACH|nr:HDR055Wp [Eremothecium sinecaudum]AMD20797.1 HDR055Wp [Eremothecium sinecaudum]
MELRRSTRLKKSYNELELTSYEQDAELKGLEKDAKDEKGSAYEESLGGQVRKRAGVKKPVYGIMASQSPILAKCLDNDCRNVSELPSLPRPRYSFRRPESVPSTSLLNVKKDVLERCITDISRWCNYHEQHNDPKSSHLNSALSALYIKGENISTARNIINQLSQLKDELDKPHEEYCPDDLIAVIKQNGVLPQHEPERQLLSLAEEHGYSPDWDWVSALAQLHDIDLQDIADIITSKHMKKSMVVGPQGSQTSYKNDIQHLSNKWNKLLTRERNVAVFWPAKTPNRKTGPTNVKLNSESGNSAFTPFSNMSAASLDGNVPSSNLPPVDKPKDELRDIPLLF